MTEDPQAVADIFMKFLCSTDIEGETITGFIFARERRTESDGSLHRDTIYVAPRGLSDVQGAQWAGRVLYYLASRAKKATHPELFRDVNEK